MSSSKLTFGGLAGAFIVIFSLGVIAIVVGTLAVKLTWYLMAWAWHLL